MSSIAHNSSFLDLPITSWLAGAVTLLDRQSLDAFASQLLTNETSVVGSRSHGSAVAANRNCQPKALTVVIPCRSGSYPRLTLQSLATQTFRDFDVIVSYDRGRGANWARNQGFRLVRSGLVLFSDDDIEWYPDALRQLKAALDVHPEASYSYGTYSIPGVGVRANVPFDSVRLTRMNYISTMSMIRSRDFPWFDESIRRFQDWDLWLTLLRRGRTGVHCGTEIFRTRVRNGITYGNKLNAADATRIIKAKHRLR